MPDPLHNWRRPRTFSLVALVGGIVALTSAVSALGDGAADAWLPGRLSWAGTTYAGVADQTRLVIGLALAGCLIVALVDPQGGLLAATCTLCVQRIAQVFFLTPSPSLLVLALYAGLAVLAIRDTQRIKRIVRMGGSP